MVERGESVCMQFHIINDKLSKTFSFYFHNVRQLQSKDIQFDNNKSSMDSIYRQDGLSRLRILCVYKKKKKRTNKGAVKNWSMKQFNKSAVLEQEPRDPDQIHKQTPFIMYCVYNQLLCVHWAISEHGYIGDDLPHIRLSTDDSPKAFET